MYVPIDVNFPDDEKLEELTELGGDLVAAAGLYVIACCLAKRLKSDGVVSRAKLRRYGATDDEIDQLVTVRLFAADDEECGTHAVRIAAYLRHNPAAADLGNPQKLAHQRWHVKGNRPNSECEHCRTEGLIKDQVDTGPCDVDAAHNTEAMRNVHAEGEDEDEDEVTGTTGTKTPVGTGPSSPPGGGGKKSIDTRIAQALGVLADQAVTKAQPDKPDAYRAGVIRRLRGDGAAARIADALTAEPDLTPTELAALVDPDPPTASTVDEQPIHPALAAHRPACETCDGMRHIETDDGTVTPCPDCSSVLT